MSHAVSAELLFLSINIEILIDYRYDGRFVETDKKVEKVLINEISLKG